MNTPMHCWKEYKLLTTFLEGYLEHRSKVIKVRLTFER